MLALSEDAGVSRVRLQDLFWSEKDPQLAAQSLRTALHGLRRSLENFGRPLIEIDATRIRVIPGALRVDLLEIARTGITALPDHARIDPPDLLEGANIKSEPFEDWLRDQRSHWRGCIDAILESEQAAPKPAGAPPRAADPAPETRPIVGLLAPVVHSRSFQTLYLGEALVDRIASGLRDYVGARTYDYRDLDGDDDPAMITAASPDLYLRLRLYEAGDALSVRALVLRQSTKELMWSVDGGPFAVNFASTDNAEILALLGEIIERLAATLSQLPNRGSRMPLTPFHALTAMFQLNHSSLDDLRRSLTADWDLTGATVYPALLAYLNTFSVGEHWSEFDEMLVDDTRRLVSLVEAAPPENGIAFSLAGHARGYILHDHDAANQMLDRAIRMSPHSAFCWDHLALHYAYNGRYSDARGASQNALRIGDHSPIRFTLETTRCMIATLEGDFETACALGRQVLSRKPNFGAALRYASVSMAHLGDTDGAQDCIRRIRKMDPSFSASWVRENRMAIRTDRAKTIMTDGLILAGAN